MTTLDQTFRDYYSSMEDADLLKLAANRGSYIDVAQQMMTQELARRHLSLPLEPSTTAGQRAKWSTRNSVAKITRVFHH